MHEMFTIFFVERKNVLVCKTTIVPFIKSHEATHLFCIFIQINVEQATTINIHIQCVLVISLNWSIAVEILFHILLIMSMIYIPRKTPHKVKHAKWIIMKNSYNWAHCNECIYSLRITANFSVWISKIFSIDFALWKNMSFSNVWQMLMDFTFFILVMPINLLTNTNYCV